MENVFSMTYLGDRFRGVSGNSRRDDVAGVTSATGKCQGKKNIIVLLFLLFVVCCLVLHKPYRIQV